MAAEQTSRLGSAPLHVYEARFGNKNGEHALLEWPPQQREFFLGLFNRADLPDTAPAGANWDAYIRGWREDKYYVVALTEADHSAIRPGMIATRMLAIPLLEAEQCDDLARVFEVLHDKDRPYVPVYDLPSPPIRTTQTVSPALIACVAHHLIHEAHPIAIIGQSEFEALISTIWQKLPAELRRTFEFGFSFTPTDLSVTKASIVAVPKSCEARWNAYGPKCDSRWDQPLSDALAAFLNDTQAAGFLEFMTELGLVFRSFSDYGLYARLWSYWRDRQERDPKVIQALMRSLGTFLPSPDQATVQKEEAMHIAAELLKAGTEEDILALRSIKLAAFPSNARVLGAAVRDWLKSYVQSSSKEHRVGLSRIVLALTSAQSSTWQEWVRNGLKQEFQGLNDISAELVWTLLKSEGTMTEVETLLPTNASTEEMLIKNCPSNVSDSLFQSLSTFCITRDWLRLMAKVAFVHSGFVKAMDLLFKRSEGESRAAAIELLCLEAQPSEVWSAAFRHVGSDMMNPAIAAACSQPALWTEDTTQLIRWAELLEHATKGNPLVLRGLDLALIRPKLYAAWDSGVPVTEVVCDALDKANALEFVGYPNRPSLWSRIPKRFLDKALTSTLIAWLRAYYSQAPLKPVLETELANLLFAPKHIHLTFPRSSPNLQLGGLMLVEAIGNENDCISWLYVVLAEAHPLTSDIAKRAGGLMAKKRWAHAAKTAKLLGERNHRSEFQSIWQPYYDSLGRLEKFAFDYLHKAGPSSREYTNTSMESTIRAVFVTALPEEFSAVCAHLVERREHTEQGSLYEVGCFDLGGDVCTVAVVQTGMGNARSAAATERALNHFKPDFAFFVGIAGGLRDDLRIGDVVAANKVYGYESGKSGEKFQPRPEAPPVSHEAEERANALVRSNLWQKRITPTPRPKPKAIVRPIAAGEKVLVAESSEDLKRVRATYTDAHAVAMEDHGFATAVRQHQAICFAVVRGISDLIENKQEADRSGSHEIAARNAAAFAFEMLYGLVRGRENKPKTEPSVGE